MVVKFLLAWIASQPDLKALVGDRVAPQTEVAGKPTPRIAYYIVSQQRPGHQKGPTQDVATHITLECISPIYGEADQVARMIIGTKDNRRLNGYRGEMASVKVQGAHFEDRRDLYDDPQSGQGQGMHRAVLDFTIWTEE